MSGAHRLIVGDIPTNIKGKALENALEALNDQEETNEAYCDKESNE
jgi:hypothetical protein